MLKMNCTCIWFIIEFIWCLVIFCNEWRGVKMGMGAVCICVHVYGCACAKHPTQRMKCDCIHVPVRMNRILDTNNINGL